jgi:hypothetical protein
MAEARVIVYSRHGCHLCEEALPVVAGVCAAAGEAWRVVDIDGDEALRALYSDDVPVVAVDGVPVTRWFADEAALRRALA